MDLFDKCREARLEEYRMAEDLGLLPFFRTVGSETGPLAEVDGRKVVMLGSNNYLGLTTDPRVRQAAVDAIERYGTGCTGSRLMNGTLALHGELEEEIADWMGTEACLVFTTGYGVNLGVVGSLVGAGDALFADMGSHASLVDGGRLAHGSVRWWRHNSTESLRARLERWRGEGDGGALVAAEGVYSMEGDEAPVAEVQAVCSAFDARLLVDEAHSLGVIGPQGAGVAAKAGVAPDLVMGTFSKSLASCGGFVAGPELVLGYLRRVCRPFQFTASGVPAALGAALCAVRLAREEEWRRDLVRRRVAQLREGLVRLGYEIGPASDGAIVPIHVGSDWDAGRMWRALLDRGVYVNCAIPPAVQAGRALLRASVMATHSDADIEAALDAFEGIRSTLG
ncbi:MAG TPA: 8-amino-7-oxononanoate synthase [Acidimicrobiales bacterium]|nr:8-amino-7-oxononanoate synthase [Acidimicrobiales bacterium]